LSPFLFIAGAILAIEFDYLLNSFAIGLLLAAMSFSMKVGFVNIFGKPNAGKSTLLNALMDEKLAIISSKVQTTRHRIKGILTENDYQIIFSDTPGIIQPKYKLHEKMMDAVKNSLKDADVALLIVDVNEDLQDCDAIFNSLKLKVPAIVVINKIDRASQEKIKEAVVFFADKTYCKKTITISASSGINQKKFIKEILEFLPEGEPFFDGEEITDLQTRFFVAELIREKIFELFGDEIPYQATVVVNEFKEKTTLIKIGADIIVQRETQKAIVLGEGGKMIKKLGTESRKSIEDFLQQKIFLELFVKVRDKWRDNDTWLKEYGYH
jgi:GTP-binding protein Era